MFTIKYNEKEQSFKEHIRVNQLLEKGDKNHPVALVNNRLRELTYMFGYDAEVEFLTLDNPEAVHIYEASLRYLIAMAFKNIYPDYKIKFKYSVSRSVFCYVVNDEEADIEEVLINIEKELQRLISLDLPFERITKTIKEVPKDEISLNAKILIN